mmetsp:Transcript_29113/g.68598  ORF Transcript_29113/g.68598 Transcript_29113/m.68598 type:complete len:215 (-) Transcript_29113:300-944(-)
MDCGRTNGCSLPRSDRPRRVWRARYALFWDAWSLGVRRATRYRGGGLEIWRRGTRRVYLPSGRLFLCSSTAGRHAVHWQLRQSPVRAGCRDGEDAVAVQRRVPLQRLADHRRVSQPRRLRLSLRPHHRVGRDVGRAGLDGTGRYHGHVVVAPVARWHGHHWSSEQQRHCIERLVWFSVVGGCHRRRHVVAQRRGRGRQDAACVLRQRRRQAVRH